MSKKKLLYVVYTTFTLCNNLPKVGSMSTGKLCIIQDQRNEGKILLMATELAPQGNVVPENPHDGRVLFLDYDFPAVKENETTKKSSSGFRCFPQNVDDSTKNIQKQRIQEN